MKRKKKNFQPGTSPSRSLPYLSSFSPFPPLICSLPLHSWLSHASSIADFLHSSPISRSHLCFLPLFPFFSPLILHSWVKTTVGFNRANLFEADIADLIKDVSTARWRPPSPSTGIKDVFIGGWIPPSPWTGPTSSKKSPSRTVSSGLWARSVPRSES